MLIFTKVYWKPPVNCPTPLFRHGHSIQFFKTYSSTCPHHASKHYSNSVTNAPPNAPLYQAGRFSLLLHAVVNQKNSVIASLNEMQHVSHRFRIPPQQLCTETAAAWALLLPLLYWEYCCMNVIASVWLLSWIYVCYCWGVLLHVVCVVAAVIWLYHTSPLPLAHIFCAIIEWLVITLLLYNPMVLSVVQIRSLSCISILATQYLGACLKLLQLPKYNLGGLDAGLSVVNYLGGVGWQGTSHHPVNGMES